MEPDSLCFHHFPSQPFLILGPRVPGLSHSVKPVSNDPSVNLLSAWRVGDIVLTNGLECKDHMAWNILQKLSVQWEVQSQASENRQWMKGGVEQPSPTQQSSQSRKRTDCWMRNRHPKKGSERKKSFYTELGRWRWKEGDSHSEWVKERSQATKRPLQHTGEQGN